MVGKTLGHFRIVDKLGEGGMGVVYRAVDESLGRHVALKVLHSEYVTDGERRQRFVREARTAAALNHPNIATVHEVGEADGIIFIAMELISGRTLAARIGDGVPSTDECLRLAIEIAEGLTRAHQANVVHRDLKPDNIRIDTDGRVKILDFGLAKLYHDPNQPAQAHTSGLQTISSAVTRDHRILGTVAYMSPEQARGFEVDARSDVFSFGIALYELATGVRPFHGDTVTDTLSAILRDPPPAIAPLNPNVPVELERILGRCLEKKPDDRYAHAGELLVDLRRLKRITDSQPVPLVTDPGIRRRRRVRASTVAAVAGLIAIGLFAPQLARGLRERIAGASVTTLAVMPFENLQQAADPDRLGQILQELIITDLTEIESLRVLSSQRLLDVHEQLGRGTGGIDRGTATAVAGGAGATKMLTGSVSRLGDHWILTAQLVDLADGTVTDSKRVDGDDLYDIVDGLTTSVRHDLGLDGTGDVAVGQRTSTSLGAYQVYLRGVEASNALAFEDAAAEFERAIEIDPAFGQAYFELAIVRWWAPSLEPLRAGSGPGPGDALRAVLDGKVKLTRKERLLAEALLPLVERRPAEARPKFEELVRLYPDEKEAWYGLGEAKFHSGPDSATREDTLTAFYKAIELDPGFSLAYYHIADMRIHQRRFEDASAEIRGYLARNPGAVAWYQDLARLAVAEGDRAKIESTVDEALAGIDGRADQRSFLFLTALQCSRFGDPTTKLALLDRALAIESTALEARIRSARADVALQLGDVAAAERFASAAVAADPDDPSALKSLFNVYDRQQRFDEGIRQAKQLAAAKPGSGLGYGAWAKLAIRKGDARETEAAIAAAAKLFDRSANPPQVGAMVGEMIVDGFLSIGDVASAERIVRQRLAALGPDDAETLKSELETTLGMIAHAAGNYAEAEPALAAARRAVPERMEPLQPLIECRIALGQPARAVEAAEELDKMGDRVPWGLAVLVETYLVTGHEVEAEKVLRTARDSLRSPRERRQLHTNLAMAYLHAGRFDDAEREIRDAAALDPDVQFVGVQQVLVEVLMRRGKTAEARAVLERALERFPQHDKLLRLEPALDLLDGDAAAAERSAAAQLARGPVHTELHTLLALSLAEQGRMREAEEHARWAVARDPDRDNQSVLAWVLVSDKTRLPEAIEIAQSALTRPEAPYGAAWTLPFVPSPEHCLGRAYLEQNRLDAAVAELSKAAALRPDRAAIRRDLARASELLTARS